MYLVSNTNKDDLSFSNLNKFSLGVLLKLTENLNFLKFTGNVSKLKFKLTGLVFMNILYYI